MVAEAVPLKPFHRAPCTSAPEKQASGLALEAAWLALLVLLWWRSALLFGPASSYDTAFNSDSAIPVLMARGPLHGLFSAYYWGQDRFGAWPYLLASGWSALTGWVWSPERLAAVQTAWLFLGALALGSMKPVGWIAASAFVSALVLHPAVRRTVLSTSQPYAWQLTALILSWWLVRQLLCGKRAVRWAVAVCGLAMAFAIWSSPISTVFLVGIIAIEICRSRQVSSSMETTSQLTPRAAVAVALLMGSVGAEALLRWAYHRAAWSSFGNSYETVWRGDRGHFQENAQKLLWIAFDGSWWVPLLAMAGVAILGVLAARKRRSEQPAEMELARESFFLAAGVCFMAFTNFFICVGARHVRLNDYNDRYLCLTHVFLDMTMYLSAAGVALWLLRRRSSARWLPAALALLTLAVTFFCLPAPARNPQYDQLRVFAAAVAKPGPSVLLGEYWSLYPLAALSPPDALIPVSPDDEAGPRTPFNVPFLTQAKEVRVLHGGSRFLDSAGRPIQRLSQYGVSLEFVGPASSQEPNELVSLYRKQGKYP